MIDVSMFEPVILLVEFIFTNFSPSTFSKLTLDEISFLSVSNVKAFDFE